MPDAPISVFISYSRNDVAYVDKLEADLIARNFRPWVDRRKLEGGQKWLDEIQKAITDCDVLVVLLTPDAVKSDFVRMEYRYALHNKKKKVIPLLYRPCEIPIDLDDLQRYDFEERYKEGLKELLSALRHIKTNGVVPQPPSSEKPKNSAKNPKPIAPGLSSLQQPQASVPQSPPQQLPAPIPVPFKFDYLQGYRSEQKDEKPETRVKRLADFQETRIPDIARRYAPLRGTPPISNPSYGTPASGTHKSILTRGGFIDKSTWGGGLGAYPIVVWLWALMLLGGLGTAVGILTQSWVWAISTVIVAALLAYVLGYRRAVHPALMLLIAAISGFVVYYLTRYVFDLSSHATIISNFWFYHNRQISIVSQVHVGLIIGAICGFVSLVAFLITAFDDDDANVGLFLGLFWGTLLLGVAWFAFAFFQWIPGFGFGPWWYTSLYVAAVGLLGGLGLGASCFVWWQALFGDEGDLR